MDRLRYSLERLDDTSAPLTRPQLDVGCFRLGRGSDCELVLDAVGVSRVHAEIEVLESGGAVVRDLGSTNGTRVDGRPIRHAAVHGDFDLQIGPVRLRLREHTAGLDRLAYATGQAQTPSEPALAGTAPGTRILTLFDRLRDLALTRLAQTPFDGTEKLATAWSARLAEIFAAWLPLLSAGGLRLLDRERHTVLAQALNGDEPDWLELATDADYRLDGDTAAQLALSSLRDRLAALLTWLPRPGPFDGDVEPEAGPSPGLRSANPRMQRLTQGLARAARGRVGILLLGETGVGKEVLARCVHDSSPRAAQAFVAVNCAALPRDLLEAELFGIEKGAATGVEARPGLFERAHGGTLFLDELGDMPLETQVRLLRALEDGRVHRVGGQRLIETDVRVVAATHQDLQSAIDQRRFRLDLYHRIAGVVVAIPPLRERPEDIAPLAIHFFNRALAENGIASPGMAADALLALQRASWPGNVRELRQAIEGAVVMLAPGEALDRSHLPTSLQGAEPEHDALSLERQIAAAERTALLDALAVAGGDHRVAWSLLGIGKTTFYKKLREQGLARDRAGDDDVGGD